ncbi:hypothetical protein J6590_079098 [Homalodisca vitripennis]|nr:hypothetical protein J6590_079098 [Homalodisca vitripennis]
MYRHPPPYKCSWAGLGPQRIRVPAILSETSLQGQTLEEKYVIKLRVDATAASVSVGTQADPRRLSTHSPPVYSQPPCTEPDISIPPSRPPPALLLSQRHLSLSYSHHCGVAQITYCRVIRDLSGIMAPGRLDSAIVVDQ